MLFLGSDDRGHNLVYDSSEDGVGRGIGPMRSLLTSLGACSGMGGRPAQQEETEAGLLRVLLRGERPQSGYPRPYKAIEVKYILSGESLKKEDVDEAVEQSMVKFCSVAATLRPGVRITYPTSCFRPSLYGENYLAEVLAPLHPLLRGAGFLQRVDAVNHLLQLSTSEELDHLQQLTLAPHVAPMETQLPTKDVPQVCDSLGPGRCPAGD